MVKWEVLEDEIMSDHLPIMVELDLSMIQMKPGVKRLKVGEREMIEFRRVTGQWFLEAIMTYYMLMNSALENIVKSVSTEGRKANRKLVY